MTGQDAVNTAKSFHDQLDFNGVVLTKLDGDSRGGEALSIRSVVDKPIKFASVGEKLDQLEAFFPDRMASRILGKGDIVSFVEKAQQEFDQDESAKLQEKLRKNKFDFEDFLAQLKQIKKMGSLSSIVSMLPGAGNALKGKQIDDKVIVKIEAVILSMTSDERSNPRILNGSRRRRIANGSGNSIQEVNRVIRQFEDMQKMMKNFNKSKLFNTMRKMNIPPTLMKNLK